jgi:hypothetical protein
MVLKTGLRVTPGPACPGRPLSETVIAELAAALDKSRRDDSPVAHLAGYLICYRGVRGAVNRAASCADGASLG